MAKWKEVIDCGEIIYWDCTACGFSLVLSDGTPKENEFYYCPRCGKKLIRERKQNIKFKASQLFF